MVYEWHLRHILHKSSNTSLIPQGHTLSSTKSLLVFQRINAFSPLLPRRALVRLPTKLPIPACSHSLAPPARIRIINQVYSVVKFYRVRHLFIQQAILSFIQLFFINRM